MSEAPDRKPRGFTLVEIMIVIVVMGMLIAIAAPAVSGFLRSSRMAGASNTLIADLHYARTLATEQRTNYEIRFNASNYSIVRVSPLTTVTTRTLPQGVTCASSGTAAFFAWGLTTPVTVTITGTGTPKTIKLMANGLVTHG